MARRRLLGHLVPAAFTAALLLLVVLLGQVPFGSPSGRATLRLALRAVHGNYEVCRDLSPEELEELPVHMRQPRICDEISPPYRLRVRIDLRQVLEEVFQPGGLRGDRPLIVDRRVTHSPGPARVQVEFEPVLEEAERTALAEAGTSLPAYRFDDRVELPADRITLVLLDESGNRLEIYSASAAAG